MATLQLRDLSLNQTTITGKRKPTVIVTDTRPRYKIDKETQSKTDIVEGYSVDIIALHGKPQTVKLPPDTLATIEQIKTALNSNKIVTVDFGTPSTLRGKPYIIPRNDQCISGISCTAETINIVKIEDELDDDYDDLVDM
jgi:hypothetical protein